VALLQPHHRNFGKRLVKSPKLYFLDTGLAAYLLGIRDAASMSVHAQRGALFETLVVSELLKRRFHAGLPADLHFWRDSAGHEVDILFEGEGGRLQAVEAKSGATFVSEWADAAKKWQKLAGVDAATPWLVYGGEQGYAREGVRLFAWQSVADLPTPPESPA
jgi:hypothetical protein